MPTVFREGTSLVFRLPLIIHFGGQANLFVAGLRQTKAALSTDKADLSSLPASKNLLPAAQKQLLELPLKQVITKRLSRIFLCVKKENKVKLN
jgi:hypothetical protein